MQTFVAWFSAFVAGWLTRGLYERERRRKTKDAP
jgi:hypothetical protein